MKSSPGFIYVIEQFKASYVGYKYVWRFWKFPKNHQIRFSVKCPITNSESLFLDQIQLFQMRPRLAQKHSKQIFALSCTKFSKKNTIWIFLFLIMAEKNVGKKMWPFSPKNKRTSSVFFPSYFSCSAGSLLPGTYSRVKLISSWVCGGNIG